MKSEKYRAFKDIHELAQTLNPYPEMDNWDDTDIINYLLKTNTVINYRYKAGLFSDHKEYFSLVLAIVRDYDKDSWVISTMHELFVLSDCVNFFEIKVNGKWQPFGAIDNGSNSKRKKF